jgi:hypothetical protein
LPDFDGVDRAFIVVLGSTIARRTRHLAPHWVIFCGQPLWGLLLKLGSGFKICRAIMPLIVERGVPVLAWI